MKVNELVNHWQSDLPADQSTKQFSIRLPVDDAARINALANMYPQQSTSQIINDLISSTLLELQADISQLKPKPNSR